MTEPSAAAALDQLLAGYDEMLAVDDVMRILNVSRPAVNSRLDAEDDPLPSYKVGKYIRIQKTELREWMLRHRRG